jgi:hypothetical protein
VSRTAPDATAFRMRLEHFTVLIYSIWEAADAACCNPLRLGLHSRLRKSPKLNFPPLGLPSQIAILACGGSRPNPTAQPQCKIAVCG